MPQSGDRIIILAILLLLAACSSSNSSSTLPPIDKLSKTAIFSIAGQHLHLPLVAVSVGGAAHAWVLCTPATHRFCSIPFDEIAKQGMEPRKLVPVKALWITLDSYNNYMDTREDSYIPIPELCPKLSQNWAQIACNKGAGGVFARNLRNFYLVEEEYSDLLLHRIQGHKENLGDIVKRMPLKTKTPTLVCNSNAEKPGYGLCISALKVGNNLVAVWVLGHSDSHKAALEQQVKTIRALVQFGFAEKEDFAALEAVLHNAHD